MSHNSSKQARRPSLRWGYLGLLIAIVLWFGSEMIAQRVNQLQSIESYNDGEDSTPTERAELSPVQLGAIVLATLSVALLGWQLSGWLRDKSGPA